MPIRLFTDAERERQIGFPRDVPPGDPLASSTLSDADLDPIGDRRGDHNRLGYAPLLTAVPYLGFVPNDLTGGPSRLVAHLALQLAFPARHWLSKAWHRLARMQQMVAHEPALAWAVSWMLLYYQLDLTLDLLHQLGNTYLDEGPGEPLPSSVIRFRVGRPRQWQLRLARRLLLSPRPKSRQAGPGQSAPGTEIRDDARRAQIDRGLESSHHFDVHQCAGTLSAARVFTGSRRQ